MKIKIITKHPLLDTRAKALALYRIYSRHFIENSEERKVLSAHFWQQIKNNSGELFTIDTLLLAINDNCIINEEITVFLKKMESDNLILSAILDFLQDKEVYWEEIDFRDYVSEEELNLELIEYVEEERKNAKVQLKKWLFDDAKFFALAYKHCPKLIANLEDRTLHTLVMTSRAAISLLINKKLVRRIAPLFHNEDLTFLFSQQIQPHQRKIHTLILLEFCAIHHPGFLSIYFRLLNSENPSQLITMQREEGRKKLLECGKDLLVFLEQNPNFFIPLVEKIEFFFEVIALADQPLVLISRLAKKNTFIANWIGDKILLIVAKLLENKTKEQKQELKKFLINNYICPVGQKKISLCVALNQEIRRMVNQLEEFGILELNALALILESVEIRQILKLEPRVYFSLLNKPLLRRFVERIITTDESIWKGLGRDLMNFLEQNGTRLHYQYVFLHASLGIDLKAKQQNCTHLSSQYIDPHCAFLITMSGYWGILKKFLQGLEADQLAIVHPFFQLKLKYERENSSLEFKESIISYLLVEGSPHLNDILYLELYCDLASGEQYIDYLIHLNVLQQQHTESGDSREESRVIRRTETFISRVISNSYFSIKFASALDETTLPTIPNLLSQKECITLIDCQELLNALFLAEPDKAFIMLSSMAENPSLVVKMLNYCKNIDYYFSQMLALLSVKKITEILFSSLTANDYLNILNTTEVGLVSFLFESEDFFEIAERLVEFLSSSVHLITNAEMIAYLFSNNKLVFASFSNMKPRQLLRILKNETLCKSKVAAESICRQYKNLPLKEVVEDSKLLFHLISKNKFFAEFLFNNWILLKQARLSPEMLLSIISDPNFNNTKEHLYKSKPFYFVLMFEALLPLLPIMLRRAIDLLEPHKHDDMLLPVINLATFYPNQIGSISYNYSLLNTSEIEHVRDDYKHSEGNEGPHSRTPQSQKALELNVLHLDLLLDFHAGIKKLSKRLLSKKLSPEVGFIPITFLLVDDYYNFLKDKLIVDVPSQVFLLINSLPNNHNELIKIFSLVDEVQQIAFIKVLYRIKQLTLMLFARCCEFEINTIELSKTFVKLLSIMANNYPRELKNILEVEKVFFSITTFLYFSDYTDFHRIENQGAISLRFLLLERAVFNYPEQKELLHAIIYELYLHPLLYSDSDKEILFSTFHKVLFENKDPQLLGYFLKQPIFMKNVNSEDLVRLMDDYPEFRQFMFIYQHLYKKLPVTELEIFLKKYYPSLGQTPTEISRKLRASVNTSPITYEHSFFEVQSKSYFCQSTSKLLLALDVKSGVSAELQDLNLEKDVNMLANFLCANKYLPLLKQTTYPFLIKQILALDSVELKFEIVTKFSLLIVESFSQGVDREVFEQLTMLLEKAFGRSTIDYSIIGKWRSEYEESNIEQQLYNLIQEELSLITNIKKDELKTVNSFVSENTFTIH